MALTCRDSLQTTLGASDRFGEQRFKLHGAPPEISAAVTSDRRGTVGRGDGFYSKWARGQRKGQGRLGHED